MINHAGPSCSKLTISLVKVDIIFSNVLYTITLPYLQEKMRGAFALQKKTRTKTARKLHKSLTDYFVSQQCFEQLDPDCWQSGPGCSKLTTSLVNMSLKFQTLISQICQYFLLKKCEKLLQCKSFSHFVNKKYQCFWL